MGDSAMALVDLHNLIGIASESDTKDEALYRMGWIHVEDGRWDKAKTAFHTC